MTTTFSNAGLIFGLTKLFSLAFLVGLIFLVVWALRNLKKNELKNWGIGLLIAGILGWLLTGWSQGYGAGHWKYGSHLPIHDRFQTMHSVMMDCLPDEDCFLEMEEVMDRMMDEL